MSQVLDQESCRGHLYLVPEEDQKIQAILGLHYKRMALTLKLELHLGILQHELTHHNNCKDPVCKYHGSILPHQDY